MRKELVFNNGHNKYYINKYYSQKDKNKPININEVDTKEIVLSNNVPYYIVASPSNLPKKFICRFSKSAFCLLKSITINL